MSEEKEFQSWAAYIRKTVGPANDKILRYFWDLYTTLTEEIKNKHFYKYYTNGKDETWKNTNQ
jgi:hypothetical protein